MVVIHPVQCVQNERNTVFFCDTDVLRMITKPSGLLVFLENLQTLLNAFGVQKEKDQKKKFDKTKAIGRIKVGRDFIENCEVEVRQLAGEQASDRILQGPDGVCSAQTAQDF